MHKGLLSHTADGIKSLETVFSTFATETERSTFDLFQYQIAQNLGSIFPILSLEAPWIFSEEFSQKNLL